MLMRIAMGPTDGRCPLTGTAARRDVRFMGDSIGEASPVVNP
jgi:hypothetical protein